jgi:hypothetical protein
MEIRDRLGQFRLPLPGVKRPAAACGSGFGTPTRAIGERPRASNRGRADHDTSSAGDAITQDKSRTDPCYAPVQLYNHLASSLESKGKAGE